MVAGSQLSLRHNSAWLSLQLCCTKCIENLQPIAFSINARFRDDIVAGHRPDEGDVKRGPGVHVGGMSNNTSDNVWGILSKV